MSKTALFFADSQSADMLKARVQGYYRKDGTYVRPHESRQASRSKSSKTPVTKTQNEGFGFHGEAHKEYMRQKHGIDHNPLLASEDDHVNAGKHADEKFSQTAHKLVNHGIMPDHDAARQYLDSRAGRHLHDAITDRNKAHYEKVHKTPGLKKDADRFLKQTGRA